MRRKRGLEVRAKTVAVALPFDSAWQLKQAQTCRRGCGNIGAERDDESDDGKKNRIQVSSI